MPEGIGLDMYCVPKKLSFLFIFTFCGVNNSFFSSILDKGKGLKEKYFLYIKVPRM